MVGGSKSLEKMFWLILFHETRVGKHAFILRIQCLNICCSRSWKRTIFHASVNHWEKVLLTAHSTGLYWYLTWSIQQIKLETTSHKESKERREKLLICKWIKFQFTSVKFKYLKKMLQTILKLHCLNFALSQNRKKNNESYCYVTIV